MGPEGGVGRGRRERLKRLGTKEEEEEEEQLANSSGCPCWAGSGYVSTPIKYGDLYKQLLV